MAVRGLWEVGLEDEIRPGRVVELVAVPLRDLCLGTARGEGAWTMSEWTPKQKQDFVDTVRGLWRIALGLLALTGGLGLVVLIWRLAIGGL